MEKAAGPTSHSAAALHAALLDYFGAPGRHQLGLRQPAVLFASVREILQIAAGRGLEDQATGRGAPSLREAAAFFLRAALLYPGADHYAVLGLAPRREPVELKERYRLLMRLIHPDFAGADAPAWPADAAVRVNRAYEVLSSPVLRREYDEQLLAVATQRPAMAPPADSRRPGPPDADGGLHFNRKAVWAFAAGVASLGVFVLTPRGEPEALVQKPLATAAAVPRERPQESEPHLVASQGLPSAAVAGPAPAAAELKLPPAFAAPVAPAPPAAAAPAQPVRVAPPVAVAAVPPLRPEPPLRSAPAVPAPRASMPAQAQAALPVAPQPLPTTAPAPRSSVAPAAPVAVTAAPPPPAPAAAPAAVPAPVVAAAPQPTMAVILPPMPALVAVAPPAVASAPPRPAPLAMPSGPTLAEAQPLLTQLLQMLETGSGDQLLRLLEGEARYAAPARALSRQYDQLVQGAAPVRLTQVEFKSEPRDGSLFVTGRVRLHRGEPTIGAHGEGLLIRAEFVSRAGKVTLKGLSGAPE